MITGLVPKCCHHTVQRAMARIAVLAQCDRNVPILLTQVSEMHNRTSFLGMGFRGQWGLMIIALGKGDSQSPQGGKKESLRICWELKRGFHRQCCGKMWLTLNIPLLKMQERCGLGNEGFNTLRPIYFNNINLIKKKDELKWFLKICYIYKACSHETCLCKSPSVSLQESPVFIKQRFFFLQLISY